MPRPEPLFRIACRAASAVSESSPCMSSTADVLYKNPSEHSVSVSVRSCWRCRPVSSRLVRILQIRAFPFRHCTEFGNPLRIELRSAGSEPGALPLS